MASEAAEVTLSNGKIYLKSDNSFHLKEFWSTAKFFNYPNNALGPDSHNTWVAKDNGEL